MLKSHCLSGPHILSRIVVNQVSILLYKAQVPLGPGIECKDKIEGCVEHAAIEDYCKYNEEFMIKYCRKTCDLCRRKYIVRFFGVLATSFKW